MVQKTHLTKSKLSLYNIGSEFENWSKEQFQNPFGWQQPHCFKCSCLQWGFLGRLHLDSACVMLKPTALLSRYKSQVCKKIGLKYTGPGPPECWSFSLPTHQLKSVFLLLLLLQSCFSEQKKNSMNYNYLRFTVTWVMVWMTNFYYCLLLLF